MRARLPRLKADLVTSSVGDRSTGPGSRPAPADPKPVPAVDGAGGIERRGIVVGIIDGSAMKACAAPLAMRRGGGRECHSGKGGGGNDYHNRLAQHRGSPAADIP